VRVVIGVLLLINLLFSEDFISKFEYGQMLYENPRGVSCKKCHGRVGEGEFIASFIDSKGKEHKFYGSDIRGLDFKTFKRAVEKGGKIMPRFYLTSKELEAIYEFIKIVNMSPKEKEEALSKQEEITFAPKSEIKKVVEANIKKEKNKTKPKAINKDEPVEINAIFEDEGDDIENIKEIDNSDIFEDEKPIQKKDNNKSSIIIDMFKEISNDEFIEDEPIEVEESY